MQDLPAPAHPQCLSASEAARSLGVSIKALRLYESHGLLTPGRTVAGYRAYGVEDMARAADVAALRALGLSLAQVAKALTGDRDTLGLALATQESALNDQMHDLVRKLDKLRQLQADLAAGAMPADALPQLLHPASAISVAFDLPWPWGGERFELRHIRPLTYLVGSLGSGKTRLAECLAAALPGGGFLGLDRVGQGGATAADLLKADPVLAMRVDRACTWLVDEGANQSDALTSLMVAVESDGRGALVVDMVEQGLDQATQEALIIYLRMRAKDGGRRLFLMTRSSSILDLSAVGPDEAIILCPPNHSPPSRVAPYPGSPGYEAVASCLASPDVRARVAHRPVVA
ncbi:MerR family transcriptional regulator [Pigmentiphaga aceris]|uniref:MerR family transcriptional regulator n=1 Tax=Pigmentiphaga aceris TaxID=1940612 RepID=A0A5C0AYQ5_9BURK|nr:MerR family transcriptional regulator [Pigmentiphaga aceris]QEI05691.1 MerR family transcriptional regulator [Pigmentiphaga aceris]